MSVNADYDVLELALKLRSLRSLSGVSGRRLAKTLGFSQSKLSKIENAQMVPTVEDVSTVLKALGVNRRIGGRLIEDALVINVRLGRSTFADSGRGIPQSQLAEMELSAKSIFNSSSIIPGLLQTPEYIYEVFKQMPRFAGCETDEMVRRLHRQASLHTSKRTYTMVIGKKAFTPTLVSGELLIDQLWAVKQHIRRDVFHVGILVDAVDAGNDWIVIDGDPYVESFDSFTKVTTDERGSVDAQAKDAIWGRDAYEYVESVIAEVQSVDIRQSRQSTRT